MLNPTLFDSLARALLSLREFHKLGPKYLLIDLSPYDVVLHLGKDKIRDSLRSYGVACKKKRSLINV